MTIPEILKELELYTGRFPMNAMRAAIEQREAITPELLRVLETVAADPAHWAEREDYMLHIFAAYLLAQFREKAAYPLLVKIVAAPDEIPDDLFGGTITEALNQILASVYDGHPELLQSLIENDQVNEFVRSAALETYLILEHTGQMPRDTVVEYFRTLFHGRMKREPSFAWDGLVCAVADLPAPELIEEVRRAYADRLTDPMVASLKELEADIASPGSSRKERKHLILDAIAELEGWAAFRPVETQPTQQRPPQVPLPMPPPAPAPAKPRVPPKPYIREKKIGRNDPCPCGSGKKYKKCCGSNV